MIQKAFTVGNSVVLTVPPKSGVKSGSRVEYKGRHKNTLRYEILKQSVKKSKEMPDNYPESISGAFILEEPMNEEELMAAIKELKENSYDPSIRIS